MRDFEACIGIDYSGAATPESRSATIQVYECRTANTDAPSRIASPAATAKRHRHWNRRELAAWLTERLRRGDRCIVGVDHGFSFPTSYFKRNGLTSWPAFLEDFVNHWPTDTAGTTVEQFRAESKRCGKPNEFRLTEKWTSSAKSVFRFDVQGSVAKSTHAGLPFLNRLREQSANVHFWPFDGWSFPPDKSVVAETYPSLFRNRYPHGTRTTDQQDAFAISHWLRDMDLLGRLDDFASPPLTKAQKEVALLEGWILGVY
jgi:hypothetical protein